MRDIVNIEVRTPVKFISGGQLNAKPGWKHSRRIIDSSVLIVVEQGRFALREGNRDIYLEPHEAVILRQSVLHYGIYEESDEQPVYCWAHFTNGEAENAPMITLPQHIRDYDYNRTISYFHQLLNEAHMENHSNIICDYLLSVVMVCLNTPQRRDISKSENIVGLVKEYIHANFRANVTLEQLSAQFNYSPDHISRVFKSVEGISFRDYLHMMRIEEAKRLLVLETSTIKDVARQVGYDNEKFFMTRFKTITGITPTQYKNTFCQIHKNNH